MKNKKNRSKKGKPTSKKQGGRPAPLPPSSMGREAGTVRQMFCNSGLVKGFLVSVSIAVTFVVLSFGAFYLGVFLKGLL